MAATGADGGAGGAPLPPCPITGQPAVACVELVSAKLLTDLWRHGARVAPTPLRRDAGRIGLYRSACGLLFFHPAIAGDGAFYRALYQRFRVAALRPEHAAWRQDFLVAAALARPGDAVLDVGCGEGAFAALVPAVRYQGLDPHAAPRPGGPAIPAAPVLAEPAGPVGPTVLAEPSDPAAPPVLAEPSDPAAPPVLAEPTSPAGPLILAGSAGSAGPIVLAGPADAAGRPILAGPTNPAGPPILAEPTSPARPSMLAEPASPAEPRMLAEPGSAAGPSILAESVEAHAARCPGAYDLVCGFQVLEHVADPRGLAEAMVRCLRPGGLLVLAMPLCPSALTAMPNNLVNLPPHHLSWWNEPACVALCAALGLEPVRIGPVPASRTAARVHWAAKLWPLRRPGRHVRRGWGVQAAVILTLQAARLLAALVGLPRGAAPIDVVLVARRAAAR